MYNIAFISNMADFNPWSEVEAVLELDQDCAFSHHPEKHPVEASIRMGYVIHQFDL